jgi:hypothetical protein
MGAVRGCGTLGHDATIESTIPAAPLPTSHGTRIIGKVQQFSDRTGMTFRWRTFGVALFIVTVVMTIAWSSWYPPFYLENDDVTIRMALEGRTAPGQPPTGFALMTHAALGWAIVAMQRALPSIPWWDVVLAGTLLWALGVLLALVWDALGAGWLARATAVGAVAVAMAPFVASLQFTISATLAGGAGALLAVGELGTVRPRRAVLAMAILLFVAGLLVRPMGGSAGAVVAALLSLPLVRARRWPLAQVLGIVGAAGVLFLAAQYADGVLYRTSDEWNAYYRYNWIVGPLLEWGSDLSKTYAPEIRESVDWSANDWLMLTFSWGVDPLVHGFDRVSQAYQVQSTIVDRVGVLSWMFARVTKAPVESLRQLLSSSALVVVAGGALVAAYATRRAVAEAMAVLLLFCALCFAIEVTFDRLPPRLLGPLQVIFVAATVVTIGASRRAASPLLGILALGAILAVTTPTLWATAQEAAGRRDQSRELANEEVVGLQRLSPSLVIMYGSRFPRELWWRPFHRPPAALPAVALGWNNQNPQLQRFLTETGRQPLLRALCTDPSILIVAERYALDLVTEYLREHYNTPVRWAQVYEGSFPAWRCLTVNHEQSEIP